MLRITLIAALSSLLLCNLCLAGTMTYKTTGRRTFDRIISPPVKLPGLPNFSLFSSEHSEDTTAEECTKDKTEFHIMYYNNNGQYNTFVYGWDRENIPTNQPIYITRIKGDISNHCKQGFDELIRWGYYYGGTYPSNIDIDINIPAIATCSASINDVLLRKTQAGTRYNTELPVTTDDLNSSVTISGPDLRSDGTLNLNSSTDITITPRNSDNIDPKTGNWIVSGKINPQIPLSVTVGSGAHAGKYSSTMTATLTCE